MDINIVVEIVPGTPAVAAVPAVTHPEAGVMVWAVVVTRTATPVGGPAVPEHAEALFETQQQAADYVTQQTGKPENVGKSYAPRKIV